MILSTGTLDRIITFAALPMLLGVACSFCGLGTTGMMLFGLGVMGGSFTEYRTEHGIWMLGSLFLAVFAAIYAAFVFFTAVDWIAGRGAFGLVAVDALLATSTIGFMIRFLWSVTAFNRRFVPTPDRGYKNDG
ncbi:MAG: hypothetical protein AAGG48_09405 [Planctomycetota bacterium]